MAKAVVNPEAELPPRPRDIDLSASDVARLNVFASLKKAPAFAKFPGTWILRHYRAGEAICRQGSSGGTAFYLLTRGDLAALIDAMSAPSEPPPNPQFRESLKQVRDSLDSAGAQMPNSPLQLAAAKLMVDTSSNRITQSVRHLTSFWRRPTKISDNLSDPSSIPNDGPTDIDYKTRQAAMYEGDVFGEISCLTRQPRSATVVATVDCFVLEFLRNILEQMHKDETYSKQMEEKYRDRVLDLHLRQLSLFSMLTADEFNRIKDQVELVKLAPGRVIWDEGDKPDALYVVRSGIVQVIHSFPWRVKASDIVDWPQFWKLLGEQNSTRPGIECLRKMLPQTVLDSLAEEPKTDKHQRTLVEAFNELAKTDALITAKDTQQSRLDPRYVREKTSYAAKEKDWTGLQIRRANRVLYHILLAPAVAAAEPLGAAHVLQYLGRGSILGEIAVMLNQPRTATCVTYAHAETDREATDVELVRVPAEVLPQSDRIKTEFDKLIEVRRHRSQMAEKESFGPLAQSRRAEDLGLLQGQKLMLIDLDRCTRCGDCVQACIDTHDDGHSRLYLDGPRFGKYLIPSSCRQCRDPVCMIGCPVGSIQLGTKGEIRIREWCIGCGLCADQCPYDSIQMHEAATVPSGAPGWLWMDSSNGGIKNWNSLSFDDQQWRVGTTPFSWGIELHLACMKAQAETKTAERIYFRYQFRPRVDRPRQGRYRLLITSQGSSVEAFLNGKSVELHQDAPQKKRSQFAAEVDDADLKSGQNVLAISVAPPKEFGATILDARMDTLAPEAEDVEEKLVTEHAVVCDQCSSLSGKRHACVYACPHDAAMRINAWVEIPESSML